jgi:FtsP/CotA-like multicopper oxidase with cupredoxin domain
MSYRRLKTRHRVISVAILAAFSAPSMAGPGFGDSLSVTGVPMLLPTYFASSPSGARQWVDSAGNPAPLTGAPAGYDPTNAALFSSKVRALYPNGYLGTGTAIRKFVDPLPLPAKYSAGAVSNSVLFADGATRAWIPVAIPTKWVPPNTVKTGSPNGVAGTHDYYEIAAVEYFQKLHSDLKKPTTLRGYVQIDHQGSNGRTAIPGSKNLKLYYADSTKSYRVAFADSETVPSGLVPVMINGTDAAGKLTGSKVQARVFDEPRPLGPAINGTKDTPVRLKFLNLLPTGRAVYAAGSPTGDVVDINGNVTQKAVVTKRNGDIFLPLDPSVSGAGFGPDGVTSYTQNRVNIHLHGGDTPWISDGTPHQWITPAGEADPTVPGSLAATPSLAASVLSNFLRGASAVNVPDMYDPGPGAMTYYFPNGQSARQMWYHDHTVGMTRLNVYAGLVSLYTLTDAVEKDLISRGVLPDADHTIPLVLDDKTFVPDDIALQDARWNTTAWGAPGDMWWPHVYETVQDPKQMTNFNAVGRWHWGPWFWPVYPSLYNLPSGAYGDVTLTPESWMDTPTVNGVAYPTITVDPRTYRFKILNGSNARMFTFNMFVADPTIKRAGDNAANVEVTMVPVPAPTDTFCAPGETRSVGGCIPENWPTTSWGHTGGVPDWNTQGPRLLQIANEGGWLPGVAAKDPNPLNFLEDKGRAAVLNVLYNKTGLMLGNAERADVVVDFSQYAGKTLIVYNDSGAPVPAADPRNEYFPGVGDQSATGGAEDTVNGYGPNSRTLMQIVVRAATPAPALNEAALDAEIKTAYKASQPTPVVAQSAYNAALGTNWTDAKAFAQIYVGSQKQPTYEFDPGTPAAFNSVVVTNAGSGFTRVPDVTVSAPTGAGNKITATAKAAMKIDKIHLLDGGSGYKTAPNVNIVSNGTGSGAMAATTLKLAGLTITNGGSGYVGGNGNVSSVSITSGGNYGTAQTVKTITVNNTNRYPGTLTPAVTVTNAIGTVTATATMTGTGNSRRVSSITVTGLNGAPAYFSGIPAFTIAAPSAGGTQATATAAMNAAAIVPPVVTFPAAPAGGTTATGTVKMTGSAVSGVTITNAGSGYTAAPTPVFSGGNPIAAASATTAIAAPVSLTFAAPPAGGRTPVATAIVTNGAITGINITDPGAGYTIMPGVTVGGVYSTRAEVSATGAVDAINLVAVDPLNPNSAGGGGYNDLSTLASEPNNAAPGLNITIDPPQVATGTTAKAGATGKVFDVTLTDVGQGYTSAPTITIARSASEPKYSATGNGNSTLISTTMAPQTTAGAAADTANGGTPTGRYLVKTKAIQELFDPTYGRLNATFGIELPYTTQLAQTTIPFGYVDPPTEEFSNNETQIWKITHNGVDTHPIHFHLLNVQLINRVGWDNFIDPPELNELGWKETIKMSPLEDTIVALRAKKPPLPGFGLPNSVRPMDPTQPLNATTGFTQISGNTGLPAVIYNAMQDYGWEYVWHCHILGHEENDFMRPVIFRANEAVPTAPSGLTATQTSGSSSAVLAWTDASTTEYQYKIERSTDGITFAQIDTALANSNSYTDTTAGANSTFSYRVTAVGQAGSTASNVATTSGGSAVVLPPGVPTSLTSTNGANRDPNGTVSLTWVAPAVVANVSSAAVSYTIQVCSVVVATGTTCTGTWNNWATGVTALTYKANTGLTSRSRYLFKVQAVNTGGSSAFTAVVAQAAK